MRELENFGIIPINTAVLHNLFGGYKSPKDKVSHLQKAGILLRLKKGLFVVLPNISSHDISVELIANHLYGPSYVSYQRALFFHGLIPERVYTIKSATIKRKKIYITPVGNFEYITVPAKYYPIGLQTIIVKNTHAYIIASPEKAICDLILATSGLRFQSKKAIREYLIDDLRIDFNYITIWNTAIIEECIRYAYKKNELQLFLTFLKDEYSI
jgi:predicted transcriptional regulator of viral defense system